ncbi:ImmA/IrrE family metallo-endopeptidase [Microbacterium sp.]|uniref:ImmA/IrrE family metallo-endopeptidase n=1 Tax=Microbacterium sp. TaxID=51671 RepID=UPI003F9C5F16
MRDPARGRAFIGVARSRNPMRQRSTLAHELAHLVFDDRSEQLGERSPEEIRADAFARHLLIPMEGVRDLLGGTQEVSESTLSDVVQRFLVSPALAAIAMRDADYITPKAASNWQKTRTLQLATRFGWTDYYAALQDDSNRSRAPQGLVSRAIAGYAAGVVGPQVIATLRGVSADTVVAELTEIGVVPRVPTASEFELDELPDVVVDLSCLDDDDTSP